MIFRDATGERDDDARIIVRVHSKRRVARDYGLPNFYLRVLELRNPGDLVCWLGGERDQRREDHGHQQKKTRAKYFHRG